MKTIEMIIRMAGGMQKLEEHSLHVFKPPYLPIHIRYLGVGPRELDLVAVAQVIPSSSGTEILESEITFELGFLDDNSWGWYPVSFRQRSPEFHHACAWIEPEGLRGYNLETEAGLKIIADAWDEILQARGYMEAGTVL